MTEIKFDTDFSYAYGKINSKTEIEFTDDGQVAVETETYDGYTTAYIGSLDELEEMIKNAREWIAMRNMAKETQEAFHENDYTSGL